MSMPNRPLTWSLLLLSAHLSATETGDARRTLRVAMGAGFEARDVAMEFVWVEALGLWVGRYEVTNAQYRRFMRFRDGSAVDGLELGADFQPAVFVSYCDALGFLFWMNRNADLPDGWIARLPSGDEWTASAAAGDARTYAWGDDWPPTAGNYLDETGGRALGWEGFVAGYRDGFAVSAPVTATPANAWGLHGLGGNVREWTSEPADEAGWHVIRGGSWRDASRGRLRLDARAPGAMWGKDNHIGLRVVLAESAEERARRAATVIRRATPPRDRCG